MREIRKLLVILVAGLVVLPRLVGQEAAPPTKKALFWKATSDSSVVYLLGSIHVGSKEMYPLAKEIEDAFQNSTVLLVEADLNHMDRQKLQSFMTQKGTYSGGDVLWNHISAETRKKLEEFCQTNFIPVARLAQLKPWMAAMTIRAAQTKNLGLQPGLGIDRYFLDKAVGGNQRVVEIESLEWQIQLISGFPDDVQVKTLESAMASTTVDKSKQIERLWLAGDTDKLEAILQQAETGPSETRKALLEDRNNHMADVAERYLKGSEQAFLVVGTAHVIGKDGIVSILKNRRYQVEQVALR